MKNSKFYIIIILSFILFTCTTTRKTVDIMINDNSGGKKIVFDLKAGKSYNHPTYVIWTEDLSGKYHSTIFVTKSFASGVFAFEMVNDSLWTNEKGPSYQPAALPYWTHKKGPINGQDLIPTEENPYVDAFSGATPTKDLHFITKTDINKDKFKIMLEVNQTWDWNNCWNNSKYPDNPAYKHSAQPSLIYSVTISPKDSVFYLNPVGHGDPKGESGKLYTDLRSLTTAKNIFESIKVTVK